MICASRQPNFQLIQCASQNVLSSIEHFILPAYSALQCMAFQPDIVKFCEDAILLTRLLVGRRNLSLLHGLQLNAPLCLGSREGVFKLAVADTF